MDWKKPQKPKEGFKEYVKKDDGKGSPSSRNKEILTAEHMECSGIPLRNPEYSIALVNLAHRKQSPRSPVPACRILGFFPNQASMQRFVKKHYPKPESSLFAMPVQQLNAISVSTERQLSETDIKGHIDTLVSLHKNISNASRDHFQARMKKKDAAEEEETGGVKGGDAKMHNTVLSRHQEAAKGLRERLSSEIKTAQIEGDSFSVPSSATLEGQTFAVAIFMSDVRDEVVQGETDPEPLFSVLNVFGDMERAKLFAKTTAAKAFPETDISVVDMYQWHFPQTVDLEKVPKIYGHKKLQSIMQYQVDEKKRVAQFKEFVKRQKAERAKPEGKGGAVETA
jgi:hypothetical protein